MARTPTDLYAFGSKIRPRSPRRNFDLFPDAQGMVGPEAPATAKGASTFGDVTKCSLTGHYFLLPAGTELPDGADVAEDGHDVRSNSKHPPTHHTIFPDQPMSWTTFVGLIDGLPWQYAGKKK